jgi:hypothetical protein
MKATLIQCTKSKRDETTPARNLYDESTYYCKMKEFAEANGRQWYILSAKYGLLHPNTVIEPYDDFGLSDSQAQEIAIELANKDVTDVDIVAGSEYTDSLIPELQSRGIEVQEYCEGLSIGKRMARLSELTNKRQNEQLCLDKNTYAV